MVNIIYFQLRNQDTNVIIMEFGIHITAQQPIQEIVEIYRLFEEMGVTYGYVADEAPSPPFRDPFAVLAAIGFGTRRLKLGTAILPVYTRHPALLAYAMKSFDELFPGRMMIGIGPGGYLSLRPLGIKQWDRPILAMRESTEILRQLFTGETVTYEGKLFQLHDTHLYSPPSEPIPIYFAARGPQMLQLTGEIADGLLCNLPKETIPWAKEQVQRGLTRSGRSWSSFLFTNRLPFSVSRNGDAAREAVKEAIIPRIAYAHPKTHELTGVNPKSLQRLLDNVKGKWTTSTKFVTDEMVQIYSVSGTPDEIIELFKYYEKQGIQQYIFGPPFGPDPKKAYELIRTEILPIFQK